MSQGGAIVFNDLIGRVETLRVTCEKCDREGRYSVTRLIERHGRNGKLTDLLTAIIADCPWKKSIDMNDQCGAHFPDLSDVL
jgi:hypothetical protein